MSQLPSLSVVVPVLDEAPALPALHRRLRQALPEGTEVIYVDDGSSDGSARELALIAASDPAARAYRLRRHLGKSEALEVGFSRARGRWVATIDADLQEDPEELLRLLHFLKEEDHALVVGWRRRRQDPRGKVLASRAFNALVSLVGGVRFRDINCGLKVMRREVLEGLPLASGFHRFIPLLAHWKGFRVGEREVKHGPRRHGVSRYGGERILHGLVDLAVVLFLVRSQRRPSRYFILLGLLCFLAGLSTSTYLAYLRLTLGTIQWRYPLLALGVLLLVLGLQVLTLGFFAELVAYHFRSSRRPLPAFEEIAARLDEAKR